MYNYAVQTATEFYQIVPGCGRRQQGAENTRIELAGFGSI
jgi:hypothetical protein